MRTAADHLQAFSEFMHSPDQAWQNQGNQRLVWFKLMDDYTLFVDGKTRNGPFSTDDLCKPPFMRDFMKKLSLNRQLECSRLFDKVIKYRNASAGESSEAAVQQMKATAEHSKTQRTRDKSDARNQLSHLIETKQWPAEGSTKFRQKLANGMIKFVHRMLPRIKKLNEGKKGARPFRKGKDLALLAAFPVVLLDTLGKPLRSKNKKARTLTDLASMVAAAKTADQAVIINEEKRSCRNKRTFVSVGDPRIAAGLLTYQDHIRQLLQRKGWSAADDRIVKVRASDLAAYHEVAKLPEDQFYAEAKKLVPNNAYKGRKHKHQTIFKFFAPKTKKGQRGWATPGLTAVALQIGLLPRVPVHTYCNAYTCHMCSV